jgi:hypothetical protein
MIAVNSHKQSRISLQMDAALKKVVAAFGPSEIVALVNARFTTRDPNGIKIYKVLKSMPGSENMAFGEDRSTLADVASPVRPCSQHMPAGLLRQPAQADRARSVATQ